MTPEEAKRLAEEYARSVPDDVHVPTLARMIEKHGIEITRDKEVLASVLARSAKVRQSGRS